jgi:PhnB protein
MTASRDEIAVRAVIESMVAATRAKDAAAFIRHLSPEVLSFELPPPLQSTGVDRAGLEAWYATWKGGIDYEVSQLHIHVGGDLALATALNRMGGTKTDGETTSIWIRATLGLRRSGDHWLVIHQHNSVPFYMDGSVKAAVDLTP